MSTAQNGNRIHELFAYLCVRDANAAIAFYTNVFGAREKFRLTEPGGRIGHAELEFGATTVMLSDEYPEYNILGPRAGAGTPVSIHIHVDNADELIGRAVSAGAEVDMPIKDQFYGERSGSFRDPFGHRWSVGHSIEQVTPDEMQRRYADAVKCENTR